MAPLIGRRLRKGAATTAVAAAAMAALTASQAPGFASASDHGDRDRDREQSARESPAAGDDTSIDGGSSYHTDLPPLKKPDKPKSSADLPGIPGGGAKAEAGIPATVLAAYKRAEATLKDSNPGCNLPWQLLAAIGKVESGQARGGNVDAEGTTPRPILGPVLNGNGFAMIKDTDRGAFDGDATHDRAVGPMQFIPSTWANWGRDGNGDGDRDPNNIYDAALAAGNYLCAGGRDLSTEHHLHQAILGYNHSQEYLNTVLSWFQYYKRGTHEVPDGTGVLPTDNRSGGSGPGAGGKGSGKGHDGKDHGGKGSGGKEHGGKEHGGGSGGGTDQDRPRPLPKPEPPSQDGETPGTPAPKPPTTPAASSLAQVGAKELSATAGTAFAQPPRVRAVDAKGKPVAKAKVRYELIGETGARFAGLVKSAVVLTGSDGTATAPRLTAGEQPGSFTVRASAEGNKKLTPVEFKATVKARPAPQADVLARIDDKALTAAAGGAFADPLTVKATFKGKVAADVPVTATMVTADPEKPVENDKGPYFLDAKGKPVRTLAGLKTNALGQLTLPKILTDEHAGSYLLRLTTADGAVLTVELTVTPAAAS
ncbi:lytic transglycosylase domain-containing protein [Streptomyces sp. NEAU-Y11]|uniref:lytic transglycosylase domain-containing protein n=1 Tax=Streptomyces cucumeris TaxID=2962890 RepID=UPI0020C8BF91|nr:lytic transglycosylase domain-containing protein [Streptomyces sp. NEAU-Y11]MCP9208319.1 lytic transglycosylase domain-containing protein [Streptomyces sp. NEAU-Y11]